MSASRFLATGLLVVISCMGYKTAQATSIPIANPSFEEYVLGYGQFTFDGVGLNGFGWFADGSLVGVYDAAPSFRSRIPDGENTAYSHGPLISQVLSSTLSADTTYTLRVSVGDPMTNPFGGYSVQFLAGGALLAEDNNSLTPTDGDFVISTIVFTALPGNPYIGEALEIRLLTVGYTGAGDPETNFDDVRLTALPVPESSTALLFALGLPFLMIGAFRRKSNPA